jgi:hypothetical protein
MNASGATRWLVPTQTGIPAPSGSGNLALRQKEKGNGGTG